MIRRLPMHARANAWGLVLAGVLAPLLAAQAEERPEIERWVPSFSINFDMLFQKAEAAITSGNVMGPPLPAGCSTPAAPGGTGELCPGSDPKIRPDVTGNDTMVAPLVGGSLELMTPALLDGFLRPRSFVHADFWGALGAQRNIAGEFSPDEFSFPPDLDLASEPTEDVIRGQGSRAFAQVGSFVFSAGLGVAFTLEAFGRTWRLKPSFEYMREDLELTGIVNRAVKLRVPADATSLVDFRQISLTSATTVTYHGIGPGLELEGDSKGRLGPFQPSLFFWGRGFNFLGSLDTTLTATNEYGETATWTWEKDPWAWRAGVGIRFRFVPE